MFKCSKVLMFDGFLNKRTLEHQNNEFRSVYSFYKVFFIIPHFECSNVQMFEGSDVRWFFEQANIRTSEQRIQKCL